MMRIHKNQSSRKVKLIVVTVCVIVILVAVLAWYVFAIKGNHRTDIKRNSNGVSTEMTDQDKKMVQNLNDNPEQKKSSYQADTPSTPAIDKNTDLQQANVVLTNAGISNGQVSASGFVSNVVESTGTCTYVFTKGSQTVTKDSSVLTNPTSTTCKTVSFSASELTSGTWHVQLKYSSPTSSGVSSNSFDIVAP